MSESTHGYPPLRPSQDKGQLPGPLEARPGQPLIVDQPHSEVEQHTIYWCGLTGMLGSLLIQDLYFVKGGDGSRDRTNGVCNATMQMKIMSKAREDSENKNHPWTWNEPNLGRYMAQGMTNSLRFEKKVFPLEDSEIEKIPNGKDVGSNITSASSV